MQYLFGKVPYLYDKGGSLQFFVELFCSMSLSEANAGLYTGYGH
jgi:hypothetical protein